VIKKLLIILVIVVLLVTGYYLLSPLFITIKADEAIPVSHAKDTAVSLTPSQETETKFAEIVGTSGHPARGSVRVVKDGSDSYIRYENFKTINGPDIYVYLAKDLDAKDFISLGKVKATEGNVNYKIPNTIKVLDYK
jgi:hypothetical protein